jgi:plastocyanin
MDPVPAVVYLQGDLPAAPPLDSAVSIRQSGSHFVPAALAVPTGTLVRFPNADPYYHNVFSYSGPRFDLGRYPPGESRQVRFDQAGVVRVFCEVHDFMRAVVVVTDHGFAAVVGQDGVFRLDGAGTTRTWARWRRR